MKIQNLLASCLAAALLVACGGGGGNASAPVAPPDPGTVKTVGSVAFTLDKVNISNSGTDKAVLTITVLDDKLNALAGVPVSVSLDSGAYAPLSTLSDSIGQVSGSITSGGDSSNRTITATITATGTTTSAKTTANVAVIGNKLAITLTPSTVAPGQAVVAVVTATNSANSPVSGANITLAGTAGASGSGKTDANGKASLTFNAPAASGSNYTVIASGQGVISTTTLAVLNPSAPTIDPVPDATVISAPTVSAEPSSIPPNTEGSSTNQAALIAKFITPGNIGIKDLRVVFLITGNPLGTGELLLPAQANGSVQLPSPSVVTRSDVIYTRADGIAEAQYVPGTRTSPTNGVKIRACYKKTNFVPSDFDPTTGYCITGGPEPTGRGGVTDASLTVATQPLSISIGDDNVLTKVADGVGYLKKFLIQVNDSSGVAVSGAVVSLSLDISHYSKGQFLGIRPVTSPPTAEVGSIARGTTDPAVTYTDPKNTVGVASAQVPGGYRAWCMNEDFDRNGFLNAGEDVNGNGIVDPRKADIIVSYAAGNKTDANGQLLVQVTYAQRFATWLAYTVKATTSVGGSEGKTERSFVTDYLKDDEENGSFWTPPYGTGACTSKT